MIKSMEAEDDSKKNIVLIAAFYYLPDCNGGTERPKNFCYYLNKYGMQTYVLTAAYDHIDYSDDADHIFRVKDYRKNDSSSVITAAVKAKEILQRRLGKPVRGEDAWAQRVKKNISSIINKLHPDVCIVTFPPPAVLDIGLYIKEQYPDIKLISDFRDGFLYAPMYQEMKSGARRIYRRFMERYRSLELETVRKSDALITIADGLTEYFREQYGKQEVYTIGNGFNHEEKFHAKPVHLPKDQFVILFTGGLDCSRIGYFEYFTSFVENNRLERLDVSLVMIGNYLDYEKEFFAKHKRMIVLPKQPRDKIIATQRQADLLLNVTRDDEPIGTNGKLYEYLFSDKPVLNYGKHNNAERIIQETDSGRSYSREESSQIDQFIMDLKKGKLKFQHRDLYKYTREYGVKQLMEIIASLHCQS